LIYSFSQQQGLIIISDRLKEAIEIYKKGISCDHEISRSLYKLGTIYQDVGDLSEGRRCIEKADEMRCEILGDSWKPATCEEDFDLMVRFWSR